MFPVAPYKFPFLKRYAHHHVPRISHHALQCCPQPVINSPMDAGNHVWLVSCGITYQILPVPKLLP